MLVVLFCQADKVVLSPVSVDRIFNNILHQDQFVFDHPDAGKLHKSTLSNPLPIVGF